MGSEKRERILKQVGKFVPEGFEEMVVDLLFSEPVMFKVVKPRSTKLGDFRAGLRGEKHQITVNGNLNKYSFLVTTLHEFAHLKTFVKYGGRVKPHGEEWKQEYRKLLVPAIDTKLLPYDIVKALVNSLANTKASSCSDIHLSRALKKYDDAKEDMHLLEELPKGAIFELQGRVFSRGELRRKRYLCQDLTSKRTYLVHALSEVKVIREDEK